MRIPRTNIKYLILYNSLTINSTTTTTTFTNTLVTLDTTITPKQQQFFTGSDWYLSYVGIIMISRCNYKKMILSKTFPYNRVI